jgi:hypothetical protein
MLAAFAFLVAVALLAHISFGLPSLTRRGEDFVVGLTGRRRPQRRRQDILGRGCDAPRGNPDRS